MLLHFAKPLPKADLPEFVDHLMYTLAVQKEAIANNADPWRKGILWLVQQFDEDRRDFNNLSINDLIEMKFQIELLISEKKVSYISETRKDNSLNFLLHQKSNIDNYLELKAHVPYIPDIEEIKSKPELLIKILDIGSWAPQFNSYR